MIVVYFLVGFVFAALVVLWWRSFDLDPEIETALEQDRVVIDGLIMSERVANRVQLFKERHKEADREAREVEGKNEV